MRPTFEPQTRVPGATRRINTETLMPMTDKKGRTLWNMPAPVRYAEHTKWHRDEKTGERIAEKIKVPVYRGVSAEFARYIQSQIRRQHRKNAEKLATTEKEVEALAEAVGSSDGITSNLVKESDDGSK